MKICFDETGSPDNFLRLAKELSEDSSVKGLMVFACDSNGWTEVILKPILQSFDKPIFGGIFPQIIHGRKNYERGVLVVGLPVAPDIAIVHGLSDPNADYDQQLEPCVDQWAIGKAEHETLVVLVDGLSKYIAALTQSLFACFGLERNFIGGGTGSLSFIQKPCLLTPHGLIADAAVVVRLQLGLGVGVSHGWQPISAGMRVTESNGRIIQSLDWRPAFEIYRELVEAHSGLQFSENNFFDLAKRYPFGIGKIGAEVVVRDPFMTDENGGIICVGEVPQNCLVKLLNGTPESLIAAAARARHLAEEAVPTTLTDEQPALFVDCISRVLYLGDQIEEELRVVAGQAPAFWGAHPG